MIESILWLVILLTTVFVLRVYGIYLERKNKKELEELDIILLKLQARLMDELSKKIVIKIPDDSFKILGLNSNATEDMITKKYKELALKKHPDIKGGSKEEFVKISNAKEECLKYIKRNNSKK